jgi:hypothetical protein
MPGKALDGVLPLPGAGVVFAVDGGLRLQTVGEVEGNREEVDPLQKPGDWRPGLRSGSTVPRGEGQTGWLRPKDGWWREWSRPWPAGLWRGSRVPRPVDR